MASIDPAELARRLDSIVAKAGPAAPLLLFLASFLEYVFPPVPGGQGHTMRYYQRQGTPPKLYIPARARAALADPTVPLLERFSRGSRFPFTEVPFRLLSRILKAPLAGSRRRRTCSRETSSEV